MNTSQEELKNVKKNTDNPTLYSFVKELLLYSPDYPLLVEEQKWFLRHFYFNVFLLLSAEHSEAG